MILIKALLTGLAGISLCMANISGIVTDSAGDGIAGAVVKLEKGGQSDTTDSNGSFMLTITGIIRPISQALPDKQSVTMHNGLIWVNVVEKSTVEIAVFDLNGKALSLVFRSMEAGSHGIALRQRGAGIYLYKVKAGNNQFVLKGNTVGGISSGSTVSYQGLSSRPPKKQVMGTAAINDVIAATKTGYLNYRVGIGNSDTNGIVVKMIASAGTVTDADGNVYQTVRIGNQVWMAENLRVTKYNDGSLIQLDTSTVTWENDTTPKYCFYNNTTDSGGIMKYGALYNWHVVDTANPKKIAPEGWHVPTDEEWNVLQNHLITNGYNWDGTMTGNKIAKSLAAKTDWRLYKTIAGSIGNDLTKNNSSGFSALPGGIRGSYGIFSGQSGNDDMTSGGCWWSATEAIAASIARSRCLDTHNVDLGRINYSESWGFSVRLVRD